MTEIAAAVDYDAEYDNRGRVPEHPSIFEGWGRDAAAYREQLAPRVIAYGPGEREKLDLFEAGEGPVVLFIHGGYWQALDRSWFSWAARGLNARGISVAVPSYDLCPNVRLGDIVEQMRAATLSLHRELNRPLVASGHSAGGHLTACLLATDWAQLDAPAGLVRRGLAISGLFDLLPLVSTRVNLALGLDDAEAARLSPLLWPAPGGAVLDAVVGGAESGEYHRQSREITERWGAAGAATRYEAVSAANHFTVIAPLAHPESAMVARLAELCAE